MIPNEETYKLFTDLLPSLPINFSFFRNEIEKNDLSLLQVGKFYDFCPSKRRVAGVVERGRLEICCPALPDRGFESLTLREMA